MRLVQVDSIPKKVNDVPKKSIRKFLEDFLKSDMDYAKVIFEPGEYVRVEGARQSFIRACKHFRYGIDVKTRGGDIYLVKRGVEL